MLSNKKIHAKQRADVEWMPCAVIHRCHRWSRWWKPEIKAGDIPPVAKRQGGDHWTTPLFPHKKGTIFCLDLETSWNLFEKKVLMIVEDNHVCVCVFHFMGWFFSRGQIHASFSEPCFERSRMSLNNPPQEKRNKLQRIPHSEISMW